MKLPRTSPADVRLAAAMMKLVNEPTELNARAAVLKVADALIHYARELAMIETIRHDQAKKARKR